MKTISKILICILGFAALTASSPLTASTPEEKPSHHYSYIGAAMGTTSHTSLMMGYRWIQDGMGVDMHATAYYLRPIGNLKSFSINPSILFYLDDSLYGGVGASIAYSHMKCSHVSEESYLFHPHITIGKEFTVSNGKKVFSHLQYSPYIASDLDSLDGWSHKVEFKTGIGF